MRKIAYLGMDVHARNCVLGDMDDSGTFRGNILFSTSENNIIKALQSVNAKNKFLTTPKAKRDQKEKPGNTPPPPLT